MLLRVRVSKIHADYLSNEQLLNSFDFVPFSKVVLSSSLTRYLTLVSVCQ